MNEFMCNQLGELGPSMRPKSKKAAINASYIIHFVCHEYNDWIGLTTAPIVSFVSCTACSIIKSEPTQSANLPHSNIESIISLIVTISFDTTNDKDTNNYNNNYNNIIMIIIKRDLNGNVVSLVFFFSPLFSLLLSSYLFSSLLLLLLLLLLLQVAVTEQSH